ncbi:hypothetical protein HNQ77_003337 [Silvibacterium bohemicum]|uniref:Uncharacterized protein n=1 Tax=Silvibacterium bohemicum TaxID=1577686 RepID=A0A841K096_9BACT|nr:hypothetical protein [Silvibacterium bohemicum]MBB6145379.1 hypothetical protein [Silvibacterium bohemicum]
MRKLAILSCLSLVSVFSLPASAQDAKPPADEVQRPAIDIHPYRIEFVVRELSEDGKVVNSRRYQAAIGDMYDHASIRTGSRVPVRANDKGDLNYIDIGINLDCNSAHEVPGGLHVGISAELTSPAPPSAAADSSIPVIRQNRWTASTVLVIGKPTLIFSSDNLESKGRIEVEVTATPVR